MFSLFKSVSISWAELFHCTASFVCCLNVYSFLCCRFFLDIASDSPPSDSINHSLSFISDGNVLALHRLLWNNQERIGQYLSSNRYVDAMRVSAF